MDVTPPPSDRLIELDVTRAVALIGVVLMNYHGYLILDGGTVGTSSVNRVFDPWTGPAGHPLRRHLRARRRHGHHPDDQPQPAQRRPHRSCATTAGR